MALIGLEVQVLGLGLATLGHGLDIAVPCLAPCGHVNITGTTELSNATFIYAYSRLYMHIQDVVLLTFRCKPGYYALRAEDPQGCLACFCYGHSDTCSSSPGYSTRVIHSEFNSG